MRIESMDATTRAVEHATEKPAVDINSQKKIQSNHEEKNITEENKQASVSEKMVISAIEKANKVMINANRSMEFSIHEITKEIMVKVIDTETKEVVREIPSEKLVDLVANLMELAGLIVDERR